MARLGEAFPLIRNGASIKQTDGAGGYPITRIETIANREVDRSKFGYADINDLGKYEDYLLHDGDILMSHINSEKHLGKVALYRSSGDEHILHGMNLLLLRADTQVVLPSYAAYFFNSDAFLRQIPNITKKSVNQASFTVTALKELNIPLPSLDAQVESVKKLDMLSNLISLRKQQLAKLDELVKARFVELFGATSADKCSKQIKDYAEVLGGYAFKSDMFCTNAVPVIRISNINNGCVDPDYDVCYDELFWEQNKRFRAEQNDILMAMSGATTGKAGLYKEDMPALINQRVACIRAKDGIACPMFLFVATQLEWMYDLIQETSAGCAQPNISGKQIENMPVPDATYEQQQQFAAFVEQTDKSKLAIQQSLDKLETLKRSLMQKYFG